MKIKGRLVKLSDIPSRTRNATPRIMKALGEEWMAAITAMDAGIGVHEAYLIPLSEELLAAHNIADARAAARPIKEYVAKHYPKKYFARQQETTEGPVIFISRKPTA